MTEFAVGQRVKLIAPALELKPGSIGSVTERPRRVDGFVRVAVRFDGYSFNHLVSAEALDVLEAMQALEAPRPDFPMPGERFDGHTVIASVWGSDEPQDLDGGDTIPPFIVVVLLADQPPFYTVREYEQHERRWVLNAVHGNHENIVPAVRQYEESGGGA